MESEIKKLFVGHLNWDTTLDTLVAELGKYGEVDTENPETKLMTKQDENTGRTLSRGFAFVVMKTPQDAAAVVNHYKDASEEDRMIDNMVITVDFARPQEKRAFGGPRTGGFGGAPRSGGFSGGNRSGGFGGGNRSGGFSGGNRSGGSRGGFGGGRDRNDSYGNDRD